MNHIGIDIGDGESCVCLLHALSDIEPRPVIIAGKRSFVSAVALAPDDSVLIGPEAICDVASREFSVRFKSRFVHGSPQDLEDMRRFLTGIHDALIRRSLLEEADSVVIGCPAGWNQSIRDRYLTMIRSCGFSTARLVSESRAAFLYAKNSRTIQLAPELIEDSALVIDIGSSTLDFAYVVGGRETDVGTFGNIYLGGGAIDDALLCAAIEASPSKAEILETFREAPEWRSYCLLAARRLKEEYFTRQNETGSGVSCQDYITLFYGDPITLALHADDELMHRIIHKGITALNGQSFYDLLDRALSDAGKKTESNPPRLVLMTGGASRMRFFQELCRKHFPDAHLVLCDEPEYSIAKGLAYASRIDEKIIAFNNAIDTFLQGDCIQNAIDTHMSSFIDSLCICATRLICDTAQYHLEVWQGGRYATLEDMNRALPEAIRKTFLSDRAAALFNEALHSRQEEICLDVQSAVDEICTKHGVSCRPLQLTDLNPLSSENFLPGFSADPEPDPMIRAIQGAATLAAAAITLAVPGYFLLDMVLTAAAYLTSRICRRPILNLITRNPLPYFMRRSVSIDRILSERYRARLIVGLRQQFSSNPALREGITGCISSSLTRYIRSMSRKTELAVVRMEEADTAEGIPPVFHP